MHANDSSDTLTGLALTSEPARDPARQALHQALAIEVCEGVSDEVLASILARGRLKQLLHDIHEAAELSGADECNEAVFLRDLSHALRGGK